MTPKKSNKRVNYQHLICIGVTIGFVALGVFVFSGALGRFVESCRDFGLSLGYMFAELFGIEHNITPTINDLPQVPFFPNVQLPSLPDSNYPSPFPDTSDGFKTEWLAYWRRFGSMASFRSYLLLVIEILTVALLIGPIIFLVPYILIKRFLNKENNDYNVDTRPLRVWKRVSKYTYIPLKSFIFSMITFIRQHKAYRIIWLIIWLFNLNAITIVLEFFAYYFYVAVSFDFGSIYRQFYKLGLDLAPAFRYVAWWIWLIVAIYLIDRMCKRRGYGRLNHMERMNRGFINERSILLFVCGTMGKRKTTLITDIALSQEVLFRNKAFELLLENDLKFPNFPWINLENDIKLAIDKHDIYSLSTCCMFINGKLLEFKKSPGRNTCFGYDYDRYGIVYDNALAPCYLWDVLENYTKLYFIFIVKCSLLISNYSIRTDMLQNDIGNFPVWNSDFFRRDSRLIDSYSRHAHILDFDALRLGKKVMEKNRRADSFEFGVLVITEIGKERGNSLELREIKKDDINANQKNDRFNEWLKMVRHSATVDNFPFVKILVDDQRPESWGADARDLTEIIHIRKVGEQLSTMPFFSVVDVLHRIIFALFINLYNRYRYNRGDNCLIMHTLKNAVSTYHSRYTRIKNTFGYTGMQLQLESGTMDGELDECKYFLMNKKIYSRRFSTDCFSDFFITKSLRSDCGLIDLPEFMTVRASWNEFKSMNSYFFNGLCKDFADEEEENNKKSKKDNVGDSKNDETSE